MPACWVIGPIVNTDGVNKPRVATLVDPGQPPLHVVMDGNPTVIYPTYNHSSAIYPERGKTWCLSYVVGLDLSAIDDDPECERVFEEVLNDLEGKRPERKAHAAWLDGLTTTPPEKVVALLTEKGADVGDLAVASKRGEYISRLGMAASGDAAFNPKGWHTS